MFRSYTLHRINPNDIAGTERWYTMKHGPQIARRYGPWLVRFESYRPVELPSDVTDCGIANYFDTEGWWRDLPDPSDQGFLGMTQPHRHARPFSCFVPAQATEDFKGGQDGPDDHFVLRWVQLIQWPEGVDAAAADAWYTQTFAPAAAAQPGLNRFFSFRALQEDIHLAGHWAAGESETGFVGTPNDHRWHRLTEMWFDDFDGWRSFVSSPLPKPEWAEKTRYPFLEPDTHFVSSFLLEAPAYDWLTVNRAFV